jgi:hypothetical protein
MLKTLAILALLSGTAAAAVEKTQELNGIYLRSLKAENLRTYAGTTERRIPYPIEQVYQGITNFADRCNNDLKLKRRFTTQADCKYHNEHLIETFVVRDIRRPHDVRDWTDLFLLGRKVYNRGTYGYYELVRIKEAREGKRLQAVTVSLRMLEDSEVRLYTEPRFSRESAFRTSTATYALRKLGPQETLLRYDYEAVTDHWLLNKEVTVPQVFATISKSMNDQIKTVEEEALHQTWEVAAKQ